MPAPRPPPPLPPPRHLPTTCLQILTIAGLGCSTSLLTTLSKQQQSADNDYTYWPPAVIITAEFWKASISLGLLWWWEGGGGNNEGKARVGDLETSASTSCPKPFILWPSRHATFRLAGLAALYALQNNLLFAAMRQVNLATYQVLISLRIPVTAGLMWAMLGRSFSRRQQGAIACLVAGVVLSQVEVGVLFATASGADRSSRAFTLTPRGTAYMATTVACASLASVTNETMLKNEAVGSLHAQNCVLYAFGCAVNAVIMGLSESGWGGGAVIAPSTTFIFRGFNAYTWALVASLTLLGLATAAVLKHADNMIRSLGYVGSIVLASAVSAAWLGTPLTPTFAAGAGVACVGIVAYMQAGGGKEGKKEAARINYRGLPLTMGSMKHG